MAISAEARPVGGGMYQVVCVCQTCGARWGPVTADPRQAATQFQQAHAHPAPMRGLGDLVARLTGWVGKRPADCPDARPQQRGPTPCEERQRRWNQAVPFR